MALAQAQVPRGAQPLHAKCVDDADVDAVVEQAAKAACEILDELLSQYGPAETKGIGSNFQGLLADHLRAMLTGAEHANKGYRTKLNPLFVRWDSFGRHAIPKGLLQGVTLMRPSAKYGELDTFFNAGRFRPLAQVIAAELYTSSESAVKDYVRWLSDREESPQAHPALLAVVDFSTDDNQAIAA